VKNPLFLYIVFSVFCFPARGQFLMDIIDTTKELGKSTYQTLDRFNHIRISGYMQPQFQMASAKGTIGFSGGNFAPGANNRFMLRRGRIRFDYARMDDKNRNQLQFVFQFDGTERGVNIRDFWGRYWENKLEWLSITTGMFARPFGYEINLSSSDREAPERGRMSQLLMRTERDMGAMISLEKRRKTPGWSFFRIDLGIFNGQGLTGPIEYDRYKDLIGQIVLKTISISSKFRLSGGLSFMHGNILQDTGFHYRMDAGSIPQFVRDSIRVKQGGPLPRRYQGMNIQTSYKTNWGLTELRAEFWKGTQTASALSSETPGSLPVLPTNEKIPLYLRNFRGGFLTFVQPILTSKNQLILKYDWYDPNTRVAGMEMGSSGNNATLADIRFSTWGLGILRHINQNLKIVLYKEWVRNEHTSLPGFTRDVSDNVLTFRAQYRF
jgi:hypothetical protein